MTYDPGGPLARRDAARGAAYRRPSPRRWLLVALVAAALLVVAGNGGRSWWARWLGERTNGNHTADFLIGLLVGLLPLIAVGIAATSASRRRALRMFGAGAAGFVVTDLLAPSAATALRHGDAATRPFSAHVPGYLAGVYTGLAVELLLLALAIVGVRRAFRRRRY
jgi:hypothetical protein